MSKPKILVIYGTRPEAIKLAPVIKELSKHDEIETVLCCTGQHKELVKDVEDLFNYYPKHQMVTMEPKSTPIKQFGRMMEMFHNVLRAEIPDWVIVEGDTTSACAGALAGALFGAKVAHVEAGLRTFDKHNPFPEEMLRQVIARCSDLHFAPTEGAAENLRSEGIYDNIFVTGNTVIDAVLEIAPKFVKNTDSEAVLITAHRRESWGQPLKNICEAIRKLSKNYYEQFQFIWPIHPNSIVKDTVKMELRDSPVDITQPLPYHVLLSVLARAALVLTDSGGIQEEAPSFGVPVLVMRDKTERPEGIVTGAAQLVGTEPDRIIEAARRVLDNGTRYHGKNPYGDGHAAEKIVQALLERIKGDKQRILQEV